jgi:hypothetical protein
MSQNFITQKNLVVCVLKTGGSTYDVEYVNVLALACKRHLTNILYEFVCLTDTTQAFDTSVDKVIPLKDDLPGWWSKMELFNQPTFARCNIFFLDLDTVIVNSLDFVFEKNTTRLVALEDFYVAENLGSGIMKFVGGEYDFIYQKFMEDPTSVMRNTPTGDQTWIKQCLGGEYDRFQTLFPRKFVSFKKHCCRNRNPREIVGIPNGASVICFHGIPKPHNITHPIISNNWKTVDT